jgi:hypothetical protein
MHTESTTTVDDLENAIGALRGYISRVQQRVNEPPDQDRDDLITLVEDVLPGRFTAVLERIEGRLHATPSVVDLKRAAVALLDKAVSPATPRKRATRRRAA